MKYIFWTLYLISCTITGFSQQTLQRSIVHDGLVREYILYVPASYAPGVPAPLLLNFHGYTSNALEQMFYGDFRPIADTTGVIVVHPQGTVDLLGNTHWNVGWGTSTVDDVGFTSALIDSLSAAYTIDPTRIYSTGMSNGGFFSYKLACDLSDRIAAIASVTGSMNVNQAASCHPEHQMPVMEIHGTADQTVAYTGNILFAPIPSVLSFWVGYNGCTTPAIVNPIADTDTADGCTAEHHFYPAGQNGATVEHYKITGGAHTWPGSAFGGVGTNQDIDACKEIWRFFSKYDIHGLIETTSTSAETDRHEVLVFPNPSADYITIRMQDQKDMPFMISNLMGQPIFKGHLSASNPRIDIRALATGIYILSADGLAIMFAKSE